MSLTEQVIAQVSYMNETLAQENETLLQVVCQAQVSSLEARLRDDLTTEDCQADFVTAAGMYALAAMADMGATGGIEQFTAGDVTVRRGADGTADYLRRQAEMLMRPYLKPPFVFVGV